jgi:hypothetical protein
VFDPLGRSDERSVFDLGLAVGVDHVGSIRNQALHCLRRHGLRRQSSHLKDDLEPGNVTLGLSRMVKERRDQVLARGDFGHPGQGLGQALFGVVKLLNDQEQEIVESVEHWRGKQKHRMPQ